MCLFPCLAILAAVLGLIMLKVFKRKKGKRIDTFFGIYVLHSHIASSIGAAVYTACSLWGVWSHRHRRWNGC